ncbi:hypothetical protein ACFU5O_07435 [Streptomyces sp. NPDC057445]
MSRRHTPSRPSVQDYAEPLGRLEAARRTVQAMEQALGATE